MGYAHSVNYPPCIRRCNKECLPFNTTLVLRGFIPRFSVTGGCGDQGESGGDRALLASAKPLGVGCGKLGGEKHLGCTGWSPPTPFLAALAQRCSSPDVY